MFEKFTQGSGKLGEKALEKLRPLFDSQLATLRNMPPGTVRDDAQFRQKFVAPAIVAIAAASGGLSAMLPGFNKRIEGALFGVRDELAVEKDGRIELVDGYQQQLPAILKKALLG